MLVRIAVLALPLFFSSFGSLAHAEEEDDLAAQTYNRWICYAEGGRPRQTFVGMSQWFPGGSGRGQAAHQDAYDLALERCRERWGGSCFSNFTSDCRVERRPAAD